MCKWMRILLFSCFLSLLLSACASTKKKAKENLEAGSYEEAEVLFQRALKEDPNDAEVHIGLMAARDGIISKRLIDVRMARLASNQDQAAQLLAEVIQKEQDWKHTPKAQVAFTQTEESTFAVQHIQSRIRNALDERYPFKAESLLRKFHVLFQGKDSSKKFEILQKEIQHAGNESCQSFQKAGKSSYPYFADFLNRYCNHFGGECGECSKWSKEKLNELYHQAQILTQISNLPPDFSELLQQDLRKGFEKSPWYDLHGKKSTELTLKGTYSYNHQKDLVSLVHNYTASEPYEAVEDQLRYRQVPYTENESRYDATTGRTTFVPVTRYRTEQYWEPTKVVRYRPVSRSYPYSALKHQQQIDLSVTSIFSLDHRQIEFLLQDSSIQEGHEHQLNLPDIGLKPSQPHLISAENWMKGKSAQMVGLFQDRLRSEWISLNCNSGTPGENSAGLNNLVQKCLRAQVGTQPPEFVNEWYQRKLGVSFSEAENLFLHSLTSVQ